MAQAMSPEPRKPADDMHDAVELLNDLNGHDHHGDRSINIDFLDDHNKDETLPPDFGDS